MDGWMNECVDEWMSGQTRASGELDHAFQKGKNKSVQRSER